MSDLLRALNGKGLDPNISMLRIRNVIIYKGNDLAIGSKVELS